jgi:hypothetical protein
MTLARIEGNLDYQLHPLSRRPEPISQTPFVITHGNYSQVAFRQWVSPEVASRIMAGPIKHVQPGTFALWFRFIDYQGTAHDVRKTFEEVFQIDPA